MLTLITPTADQPTGIALCERFMSGQNVKPDQWIVVDDGEAPATLTMGQTHIRRVRPLNCKGFESFGNNLLVALPLVRGDIVAFIEHDDWYAPDHLESLIDALAAPRALLAGDDRQHYYNVAHRCWREFANVGASLCQTAIRREALEHFAMIVRRCLGNSSYGVDTTFWRSIPRSRWAIISKPTCVGIKGLPGRPGLGIGHRPGAGWTADRELKQLRDWIGEDADLYAGYRGVAPAASTPCPPAL